METEAIRSVLYLILVLGGGVMVGVLTILFIISIVTFGAWVVMLISSLKSRRPQADAGLGETSVVRAET